MLPRIITLHIRVTRGWTGALGTPHAFCRLILKKDASFVKGASHIFLVATDSDSTWKESTIALSDSAVEQYFSLLDAMFAHGSSIDVEGCESTADAWTHFDVVYQDLIHESRHSLECSSFSTGFVGRDASHFIALLQLLASHSSADAFLF